MIYTINLNDCRLTKCCTCCGEEKLLSEFHRDYARPDHHHSVCKLCRKARRRTKG